MPEPAQLASAPIINNRPSDATVQDTHTMSSFKEQRLEQDEEQVRIDSQGHGDNFFLRNIRQKSFGSLNQPTENII